MTDQYRLGVDIGGTFTDAVLVDSDGTVQPLKVPTTPDHPGEGFLNIVDLALETGGFDPEQLVALAHATTTATNAIIEGTGARVALVVTRGFRDMLEIARQIRPDLFDLRRQKPQPLVPRDRVVEVDERLGPNGQVITPLTDEALDALVTKLRTVEADAIVVCLLHAYADPRHEQQVLDRLTAEFAKKDVSISSDIWPEFREYFRASTAIVNAMVRPIVGAYLRDIRNGLETRGLHRPVWVMQSSGGVLAEQSALDLPVQLIESGPAAGLIYAAHIGKELEQKNLVSFEIGGTTAKVGLIVNGVPSVTTEFEVGAMAASGGGRGKGSGYPIRTPVLDLIEIGNGGGSIAWIDPGGALRVGPRSSGSLPGPACYGRGGQLPTLTDANLVLGRIDPDRFLGGAMQLDVDASVRAIEEHCATPLGRSVADIAEAIIEVATANMVRALRLVTVERGHDPRDFSMLAFGGAGPLHACLLSEELGFEEVIIPVYPGVLSAAGLLVAPIQVVESRTELTPLTAIDVATRTRVFAPLVERATAQLIEQGITRELMELVYALDLRYVGQSYELTVSLTEREFDIELDELTRRFNVEHERAYGHASSDQEIEAVNWRVTARERTAGRVTLPDIGERTSGVLEPVARRQPAAGNAEVAVYDRGDLLRDDVVDGPAVIAEAHSTTFVPHGHRARADYRGNLHIAIKG